MLEVLAIRVPAAAKGHLCLEPVSVSHVSLSVPVSLSTPACLVSLSILQCPWVSLSIPACLSVSHVSLSVPHISQCPCMSLRVPHLCAPLCLCIPMCLCVPTCLSMSRVSLSVAHVSQCPCMSLRVPCLCVSRCPTCLSMSHVSLSVPHVSVFLRVSQCPTRLSVSSYVCVSLPPGLFCLFLYYLAVSTGETCVRGHVNPSALHFDLSGIVLSRQTWELGPWCHVDLAACLPFAWQPGLLAAAPNPQPHSALSHCPGDREDHC